MVMRACLLERARYAQPKGAARSCHPPICGCGLVLSEDGQQREARREVVAATDERRFGSEWQHEHGVEAGRGEAELGGGGGGGGRGGGSGGGGGGGGGGG